ncbi:hypothetical protein FRC04_001083 [Tulasnella sp. 424]|nr:hypothetical protein FRC04_001083 [Tulasnella sp. 424]KAG8969623.1 hypothetical protein FRC05_000988 [Tulasnella sp. 425]
MRNGFDGLVSKTRGFTAPPTVPASFRHLHNSRAAQQALEVPDFSAYKVSSGSNNRALSYFFVGSMGVASASLAKSTVTGSLSSMAASADVLALAKAEVDTANIHEDAYGHAHAALDLCHLQYTSPFLFEIRPNRRERYY